MLVSVNFAAPYFLTYLSYMPSMALGNTLLLFASYLNILISCSCVPYFPEKLLHDPTVIVHSSVVAALAEVQRNLTALCASTTRDGLSFAVVSAQDHILTSRGTESGSGILKNNETGLYSEDSNVVTSDSIFRIISVSKSFALSTTLIVENILRDHANSGNPGLTLDMPVRFLLPKFNLPQNDWNDGGSEITLRLLASHTAGISRESYSTRFNMVLSTGKADAATIGSEWAAASADQVISEIATSNLMFAPGQRAAYSNAGYALLGAAVASHYNNVTASDLSWSQIVTEELLTPLNMTHSFFGRVPQDLIPDIGVPGGDSWVDLIVGSGYDPAAGMWSSASDLAMYLYSIWLQPEPTLITRFQRRHVLKPAYVLQDGKQQVGAGWEIQTLTLSTRFSRFEKSYSIFGKSGDGGGWHSWIDVVPSLGYGIIILSQQSGLANSSSISPTQLRDSVHDILAPAFAEALAARMMERFAGMYDHAQDTGFTMDQVSTPAPYTPTYAKVQVEDQILYLRELVINGTSALEAVDRLSWEVGTQPRYFSTPRGVVLEPAEGSGETAQFGPGAQVWRMIVPGLAECDWFDFDGYKDTDGWPLSKVVLVEREDGVDLHYPPFDVVMTRLETGDTDG
ncbi:beta-lactamase/transpeptidase-like protein [Plenodomus tracheiphilus IPT5]|uniref:Beta-lactamase/transpeptidase-like protein n=1 Tax=Plenodomus tracheiphilus IPT5 TaxID=1408161 RepID=A0A6A7AV23_9PLEO|nr:beta-lactamase/transpeptidase-like protein [Plenodomus tracheiphilus IPT5]